jgi:starch synthase
VTRAVATRTAPVRRLRASARRPPDPIAAPRADSLRVLMVASEAAPFAKTGGLADVMAALPAALDRLGHHVTVVVPRYRGIAVAGEPVDRLAFRIGGVDRHASCHARPFGSRSRFLFVDCPELYDRDALYGRGAIDFPDNALRFGFLARASIEIARRQRERFSLIHAHDWQAGLVPVYLRTMTSRDPKLTCVPVVFTIHNMAYQGLFPPEWMPALDLGWELYTPERLEYWGRLSFLKAGVNYGDILTTVSPTYAKEILDTDLGFGFQGILARRRTDLYGILNGIDTTEWDPKQDRYLPRPFSARDLSGKREAKAALLAEMGIPVAPPALDRPLVGMVSRLIYQKGFDLIAGLTAELPELDATFVLVGSGDLLYERMWRDLAAAHPERIAAHIGFDERLAHLVEAGADMFLMPSRFEPCGLNQMYSLRYGTVPIVRATGGLEDTVTDYDPEQGGTGFKFAEATPQALLDTLIRALEVFRRPREWRTIQLAGMRQDYSWDVSAAEYVKLYSRVLSDGAAAAPSAAPPRPRRRRTAGIK